MENNGKCFNDVAITSAFDKIRRDKNEQNETLPSVSGVSTKIILNNPLIFYFLMGGGAYGVL